MVSLRPGDSDSPLPEGDGLDDTLLHAEIARGAMSAVNELAFDCHF
jgi:hypothetical protein